MNILIVKTSSLGDIVHVFATLDYLRTKFPDSQIDWVVEKPFAEVLEAHPQVDTVLSVDTKKWRKGRAMKDMRAFLKQLRAKKYDVVFDLQGNIKSGLITFFSKARKKVGFGKKSVSEWPNLLFTSKHFNPPSGQNIRDDYLFLAMRTFNHNYEHYEKKVLLIISDEEKKEIKEILSHSNFDTKDIVMVCPGSRWRNKRLPTATLLNFLKQFQREKGVRFLFVWGTQDERKVVRELYSHFLKKSLVIDKLSLPVLQNLMDKVSLVISMDSLPLHLAATVHTPTLSVFGASSLEKYKPKGNRHKAIQGLCPYNKTFEKRCPILRTCVTGACIRDIKTKDLHQLLVRE